MSNLVVLADPSDVRHEPQTPRPILRSDDGRLGKMGEQVRRRRFAAHNREWLRAASQVDCDTEFRGRT